MPGPIRWYVGLVTRINRVLFLAVTGLMLIIVPVMLYEVAARYFFGAPTVWGMELATMLFGPYFLLGGPYLLHLRGHVNLDLVRRRLSPERIRQLDLFNHVIIMAFCVILATYSLPLALQSLAFHETSFSAWNPPVWPLKFAVPVAVILLGAQSLAEFLRLWVRDPAAMEVTP